MNFAKYSVKKNTGNTIAGTSNNSNGGVIYNGASDAVSNDWFYKDTDNNLHCKYNFVGDKEIAAYGASTTTDKITAIKSALAGITSSSTVSQIANVLVTIQGLL